MNKILIVMAFSLFGYSSNGQNVLSKKYELTLKTLLSHTVDEVNVADVISLEGYVILDAREKEEYNISTLPEARFVGYNNFSMDSVSDLDKSCKILVYCSVGYRSEKIAERLLKEGFTDVANLYGGIFEWKNQNKEVFHNNVPTEKVHAFDRVWGLFLSKGEKVY